MITFIKSYLLKRKQKGMKYVYDINTLRYNYAVAPITWNFIIKRAYFSTLKKMRIKSDIIVFKNVSNSISLIKSRIHSFIWTERENN